jgi:hypothetical protein
MYAAEFERFELNSLLLCIVDPRLFKADAKAPIECTSLSTVPIDHGSLILPCGTIFLIVCLLRAYAGHFSPTQHLGFEFAAWYWHFVDVVWLFLFICIYVWGHGAETMAHGAH